MEFSKIEKALLKYNLTALVEFSADEIAERMNRYQYLTGSTKNLFLRMMKNYPGLWKEVASKLNKKVLAIIEKHAKEMNQLPVVDLTYDLTNSHDKSAFKARIQLEESFDGPSHRWIERMQEDGTWTRIGELK